MSVVVGGPIRAGVDIGDTSEPDFCRLPDPATLFSRRAGRLAALSAGHDAGAYLCFLAEVCEAQDEAVRRPSRLVAPDPAELVRSREQGFPPLRRIVDQDGIGWRPTLDLIADRIADRIASSSSAPPAVLEALGRLREAGDDDLALLAGTCVDGEAPADAMGEALFVYAALQVEFAKLAAMLDPRQVGPVGDGVCPACGSAPVASLVVGWQKAQGSRYLCCGLCATAWNYVRIKCANCASTKGVAYYGIEDQNPNAKGETCEGCRGYLKHFLQQNDPLVDPVADDVATLGLDVLLREAGWHRCGSNLFLLGS